MVLDDQNEDEEVVEENVPQFMTIKEVAQRLRISRSSVKRFIKRKNNPLPVVYLSDRTPRIPWAQFNLWVDSQMEDNYGQK